MHTPIPLFEDFNDGIFYHQSSVKFDKFDINKAGTDNSSTVHGYGLYFSETSEGLDNYSVAKGYLYEVKISLSVLRMVVNMDDDVADKYKIRDIIADELSIDSDELEDVLGISDSYMGEYCRYKDLYDHIEAVIGMKKTSSFMYNYLDISGFRFKSKESKRFGGDNLVLFSDEGIKIVNRVEVTR